MGSVLLRRAVTVALLAGAGLPFLGQGGAHAMSAHQTAPANVDPARPAVTGKLVAKAGSTAPVICGDRDRTAESKPLMINRGLVVCTEEGNLVLLQLSPTSGLFNAIWQHIGYRALALGDRLNAWGTLRADGKVLHPTVAVQDLSRSGSRLQTVSGRLVAKPNVGPSGQVICGDRDRSADAQALSINRGLVICTVEGKLVLIQLSANTKVLTSDRAPATIEDLTLGDHLKAHETLGTDGQVLNPTAAVVDTNIQRKHTASQDFVANAGSILTLYVLKSDPCPVKGLVHAAPGEPPHVTLCNGSSGTWTDLRQGFSIDVSNSVFNTRTMTYVDTNAVRVISCP